MDIFTPLISVEMQRSYTNERLVSITQDLNKYMVMDQNSGEFPISLSLEDSLIDEYFLMVLEEETTVKKVRAERNLEYILSTPIDVLSFDQIHLSDMTSIDVFISFIKDLTPSRARLHHKMLNLMLSFFLRLPNREFGDQKFLEVVRAVRHFDKNHPFVNAISSLIISLQIRQNVAGKLFSSSLFLKLNEQLTALYKHHEDAVYFAPYCTQQLAQMLKDVVPSVMMNQKLNGTEFIQLISIIPMTFVLLASLFPPALETIEWQRLLKMLVPYPSATVSKMPPHTFAIKNHRSCSMDNMATATAAMMLAFTSLAQLNEGCANKAIIFETLRRLALSGNLGQQAVAQSLLNINNYQHFKDSAFVFKDSVNKSPSSALLYLTLFECNFSDLTFQLEQAYQIASIYRGDQSILNQMVETVANLTNGHICSTVEQIIRLLQRATSPLAMKKVLEETSDVTNYMRISIDMMKRGDVLKNPNNAIIFAAFASKLVELLVTSQKPFIPRNVRLILALYDHIMLCSPPAASPVGSSFESSILEAQQSIAKSIAPFAIDFFKVALLMTSHQFPSLMVATLSLLVDYIEGEKPAQIPSEIADEIAPFIQILLLTESPITLDLVGDVLVAFAMDSETYSLAKITHSVVSTFCSFIKSHNPRDSDSSRVILRMLYLLSFATIHPEVKSAMRVDEQHTFFTRHLIDLMSVEVATEQEDVSVMAVEVLSNLVSPQISVISHIPIEFRGAFDTVDSKLYPAIVEQFKNLLQLENIYYSELFEKMVHFLLSISESPYFVQQLKESRITIEIDQIPNPLAKLIAEMVINFSKLDYKFALDFIVFSKSREYIRGVPALQCIEQIPTQESQQPKFPELSVIQDHITKRRYHPPLSARDENNHIPFASFIVKPLVEGTCLRAYRVKKNL